MHLGCVIGVDAALGQLPIKSCFMSQFFAIKTIKVTMETAILSHGTFAVFQLENMLLKKYF